jgi:nitrite reductase/ring-hydroxylating ferredoxin subunit
MDDGWVPAFPLDDVPVERATAVDVEGETVLLYRTDERIFAIGNRCTHQGAPLHRGPVKVGGSLATVTCPAHGSVFHLADGSVVRGPASTPVAAFEARVTSGIIELRPVSGTA